MTPYRHFTFCHLLSCGVVAAASLDCGGRTVGDSRVFDFYGDGTSLGAAPSDSVQRSPDGSGGTPNQVDPGLNNNGSPGGRPGTAMPPMMRPPPDVMPPPPSMGGGPGMGGAPNAPPPNTPPLWLFARQRGGGALVNAAASDQWLGSLIAPVGQQIWSADGTWLAQTVSTEALVFYDLSSYPLTSTAFEPQVAFTGPAAWLGDGVVLPVADPQGPALVYVTPAGSLTVLESGNAATAVSGFAPSPRGDELLYGAGVAGSSYDLYYLASAAGTVGTPVRITPLDDTAPARGTTWSPDARWVVFRGAGVFAWRVLPNSLPESLPILESDEYEFSPDGSRLLLTGGTEPNDLRVADMHGDTLPEPLDAPAPATGPRSNAHWDNRGDLITYFQGGVGYVARVHPNGATGPGSPLANMTPDCPPQWGPPGQMLYRECGGDLPFLAHLTVDAQGSIIDQSRIAEFGDGFRVSPDGQCVAAWGAGYVNLANFGETASSAIEVGEVLIPILEWAPDGSAVAWVEPDGAGAVLYSATVDGCELTGETLRLARLNEAVFSIEFLPLR